MTIPLTRKYCSEKGVKHCLTYKIIKTKFDKSYFEIGDLDDEFCDDVYGLEIDDSFDGKIESIRICDISSSSELVWKLICKMANGIVTPICAGDVVEDFLA